MLQNRERLKTLYGIDGDPSPKRAAEFFITWHESWGAELDVVEHNDGSVECVIRRSRLHEVGEFSAPENPFPASLEAAMSRAWQTVIAYDCPNVEAIAKGSMQDENETWSTLFRFTN